MSTGESANAAFRRFAAEEAARYGSDEWVWVRELLQNARDAGARRIDCRAEAGPAGARLVVGDDGCGMSLDHARRYLLALYASSKEDDAVLAGRFGVGFWSVLRLRPDRILVRSRPTAAEPGWEIEVRGDLEDAVSRTGGEGAKGTEIVLERADLDPETARRELAAAVERYGRFLMRADRPDLPLEIRVEGRRMNRSFELPAPSASFRGAGFRGIVALGEKPSVELFSHGLLVRTTPLLRDLVEETPEGEKGPDDSGLEDVPAAAPRFLLDSSRLDLLLARSDARQDRELRRLVARAESELRLLIGRQLDAIRPQPWWTRVAARIRDLRDRISARHVRVAGVLALALGVGAAAALVAPLPEQGRSTRSAAIPAVRDEPAPRPEGSGRLDEPSPAPPPAARPSDPASGAPAPRAAWGGPRPYRDLADRYRGPSPASQAVLGSVELAYHPADRPWFFAALRLEETGVGAWEPGAVAGPYRGEPCRTDCLEIAVRVAGSAEPIRLPVPTGHRLDAGSVRLAGRPVAVASTMSDEPVLVPEAPLPHGVTVRYRTAPSRDEPPAIAPGLSVPPELEGVVAELRALAPGLRPARALAWVESTIAYRPSPMLLAARDPSDWLRTALVEGAGDCDVQNAALATVLRRVGRPARLAIGVVGAEGRTLPGLHAWAEVHDPVSGSWEVADASTPAFLERFAARGGSAVAAGTAPGGAAPRVSPNDPAAPGDPMRGAARPSASSPGSFDGSPPLALLGAVGLLLLVGAGWLVARIRRARHRTVRLGADTQLPALLAGALRHPESFGGLPALRYGRLVPVLAGRAISLDEADRRAREGRLLAATDLGDLARRAVDRGEPVLDLGSEEGRIVAGGLGAIDLDEWRELLGEARRTERTSRLDALLPDGELVFRERPEGAGSNGATRDPRLLDLARFDLGERIVLLPPDHVADGSEVEPPLQGERDFSALDGVLHGLGLDPVERDRILGRAASRLIHEEATA